MTEAHPKCMTITRTVFFTPPEKKISKRKNWKREKTLPLKTYNLYLFFFLAK